MSTLWLKPERPKAKGGMADIIATMDGVQLEIDQSTSELHLRARQLLRQHVNQNEARVVKTRGDIDGYVVLIDGNLTNDEDGDSNSALSIEFGRAGYFDPETGEKWGAMAPLRILGRAAQLMTKGSTVRRQTRVRKLASRRGRDWDSRY